MRVSGEAVPVKMPLIFADNRAINHAPTMKALVSYYNTEFKDGAAETSSPLRQGTTLDRRGQPVVMGLEKKPGDTTYETAWWRLKAEGREDLAVTGGDPYAVNNDLYERTPLMVGQDQPPFYPLVDRASCRLTQVERLTGQAPIWVETAYDPFYVREGFPDDPSFVTAGVGRNTPEAFLVVTSPIEKMTFAGRGNLSGSVAHPEMNIVAISRTYGPLSKSATSPSAAKAFSHRKRLRFRLPSAPIPIPMVRTRSQRHRASRTGCGRGVPQPFQGHPADTSQASRHRPPLPDPRRRPRRDRGQAPEAARGGGLRLAEITEGTREARAILRDTVIQPILDLVKALQEKWAAIAVQRQGGEVSLAKAFPQIGADLEALGERLRKCLAAGTSDAAFMADLAEAHSGPAPDPHHRHHRAGSACGDVGRTARRASGHQAAHRRDHLPSERHRRELEGVPPEAARRAGRPPAERGFGCGAPVRRDDLDPCRRPRGSRRSPGQGRRGSKEGALEDALRQG